LGQFYQKDSTVTSLLCQCKHVALSRFQLSAHWSAAPMIPEPSIIQTNPATDKRNLEVKNEVKGKIHKPKALHV